MLHAIARTKMQILSALYQRIRRIFRHVRSANWVAKQFLRFRHRRARLNSIPHPVALLRRVLECFLENPCDHRRNQRPKHPPQKPFHVFHTWPFAIPTSYCYSVGQSSPAPSRRSGGSLPPDIIPVSVARPAVYSYHPCQSIKSARIRTFPCLGRKQVEDGRYY